MTSVLPTRQINTLNSHTGPINCIAFSNLGGTYILTGSSDRSIHLSRTEPPNSTSDSTSTYTSEPIQKYTSHGYAVLSLSVSGQNTHFASTGGDRSVFYWDIQTPSSTLRRFGSNTNQAHTSRITCVSFAGLDDGLLISGSDDRSVRIWDVKSRDSRPLQILEDAKDSVSSLVAHGVEIIAGSVDGRVRTYDVRMGGVITDVQPGPVTSLDLSADGKMLLVGCLDGKIRVMDRVNGQLLRALPAEETDGGKGPVYKNEALRLQSCFGADAALVLSGSEDDGRVRAWDVVTGKMIECVTVSPKDKVVSVVKWREGGRTHDQSSLWAAGGIDAVVRLFAD